MLHVLAIAVVLTASDTGAKEIDYLTPIAKWTDTVQGWGWDEGSRRKERDHLRYRGVRAKSTAPTYFESPFMRSFGKA